MATGEIERQRLIDDRDAGVPWKKWGPYLSERQWGTVREDYSASGDAWSAFTHDEARSRAYRWGEDGIAGFSDDQQLLCFALALWNGKDPILKERLFGLTNLEGNHGEDVKEQYFYLDSTPTHSYMKFLYKYPHAAFPYDQLVAAARGRSGAEREFELLDTGVFDQGHYCDIFVEYAKATPETILIRITVCNRSASEAVTLDVLPTLWFRNTWSWESGAGRPRLARRDGRAGHRAITAQHAYLGERVLYCEGSPELLFTENETNRARLWGELNPMPYVKDGIHDFVVAGRRNGVNPALSGTKAAARYRLQLTPGETREIRLRLADGAVSGRGGPFNVAFDKVFEERKQEADAFYADLIPYPPDGDTFAVIRQALAGLLWSKQYYNFDVDIWLREHGYEPHRQHEAPVRNRDWAHMQNADIVSMPDKWEYPWYAAWDLAFHAVPLTLVDREFAKSQLELLLREDYMHPNGQLPAYEWNFGDVNPPVHAWAAFFVYTVDGRLRGGRNDIAFLRQIFQKLLINFTWWVNRKDPEGRNVFGGGFLGLDNIGVFDRSAPLPTGGRLEQSDGTAWMAFYAAQMLRIAVELARDDPAYEDMALKFFEHFLRIAAAMDRFGAGSDALWDEADGFFYDVLRLPDGTASRLKVRSVVGLLPLAAVAVIPAEVVDRCPALVAKARSFLEKHPEAIRNLVSPAQAGVNDRRLIGVLDERKLRRLLRYMLDEDEFLSPYGIRSLSRYHLANPYRFSVGEKVFRVDYEPGEAKARLFGGNSNWRGPIWFPVNALLIRGLLQHYLFYGNALKVECPTGSGRMRTLFEVAVEICERLLRLFLADADGRRPVHGDAAIFRDDPHWQGLPLFHEYFDGDSGAGLGASHQTGWTGLVAALAYLARRLTAADFLRTGEVAGMEFAHIDPRRRRRPHF